MRFFLFIIFFTTQILAIKPSVEERSWNNGITFLTFLEDNSMPLSLYYNLEREDQELASGITAGTRYQILRDDKNKISQVLIPINEELQIQIYKDKNDKFKVQLSPISFQEEDRILSIKIQNSPYQDIVEYTNSADLANAFTAAMNGQVDFKKIKKGDRLIIFYTQKRRLGRVFGMPEIHSAMLEVNKKQYSVYKFNDKFYDKSGKERDKFFLIRPIINARITSPFTLKRYHPVLKRYRAHLGVDYGAPKGTPIKSAGDGLVKFAGQKGGYGNVLIIGHANGYETLYAHLNGFAKGIKSGVKIKQGQIVAYVGNSGMSTGPHLHFGLYRNTTPLNPESMLKIQKSAFSGSNKTKFQNIVNSNDIKINKYLNDDMISVKEEFFENVVEIK
ncbi:MAG: peptidoglycan DD-metalloendopeptidase family protein [Campylobacter sp.]